MHVLDSQFHVLAGASKHRRTVESLGPLEGPRGFDRRAVHRCVLYRHGQNERAVFWAQLQGVSYAEGDPTQKGVWQERVADQDVVINLAGASIFRRWSDTAKKLIWDSRIQTSQNLVEALSARKGKETHLFSTSAVGYYGFHEDEVLEESSPWGGGFLADLSKEWESAAMKAKDYGVHVTLTRFGIVLGRRGGALQQMIAPFKWWMGSPLGSGNQWFSWIHEQDLVDIFLYLIKEKKMVGLVLNAQRNILPFGL